MPSTIGPFNNVPAAGDALASAWAQQLTQYAVNNKTAGDAAAANLAAQKLDKAGDTLTGPLHAGPHLYADDIIHFGLHWIGEADNYLIVHSDKDTYIDGVNVFLRADESTVTQQSNAAGTYFPLPVSLAADPTYPTHVATKQYVDAHVTPPPAWVPLPLVAPWVSYGGGYAGNPYYRKVGDMIELKGWVGGGAMGDVFATLPVGARPAAGIVVQVPAVSADLFSSVRVTDTGNLTVQSFFTEWLSLTGIRFAISGGATPTLLPADDEPEPTAKQARKR